MKFYERAEVKDVLAYLRLAARPEDDLAFRRVVNVPARGIGAATLDRLAAAARESGQSWWEVSGDPAGPDRARAHVARALPRDRRATSLEKAPTWTPSALLDHLLPSTGYAALYERSEDREDVARRENIEELLSSAREFERRNAEGATIAEYLDTVALATDGDAARGRRRGDALDAPRGQGARVRSRSSSWASRRATCRTDSPPEDEDELEEERRLLYVGMTRAKDALTLTLADRRLVYGRIEQRRPSRFLEEIPREALEEQFFGRPAPTIFSGRVHEEEPSRDDRPLRRGKRVRHPRYGYGVILTEEGSGEETRLTVYFDRAGKKKFVARYADLTPA